MIQPGPRKLIFLLVASLLYEGAASAPIAQMIPPQSGVILTPDGMRLFYRTEGSGADRVIALHGGPGLSMSYLRPELDPLAQNRIMIYYDQRGAGRSSLATTPAQVNLAKHLADLETVRRFFGIDRLTLLGHSWGAGLAAHYAVRYPSHVRRLLLVSPMPVRRMPHMVQVGINLREWMDDRTRNEVESLAAARENAADPVAACRAYWAIFIRGYLADRNNVPAFRGDVCDDPPEAVNNQSIAFGLTMDPLGNYDWRAVLNSIKVPTLVIHGEHDPIPMDSAREWAASIPNARLLVIPHSGHFPFVEQPNAFFPAADQFLRGQWPAGATIR
jgi:proline iminopeptidase